ncbi:MAG: hypothetical protein MPJ50_12965 [Pirellulales bacterium]|nr:hypothetical protein [Pirellulales bacterium]
MGEPKLVMAIWKDGHAVWSKNKIHGGAPYFTGKADAGELMTMLDGLAKDGFFDDEELGHARFGPDARLTTILVKSGKHQLKMQSWHELYEFNGRFVATDAGLQALNGRSRLDALAGASAAYLHYRMAWAELKSLVLGLAPDESQPLNGGGLEMKAGAVSWRQPGGR